MTAQSEEDSQFEDLPDEDIYMSNVKALRSAAEPVYASKAYLRVAANAGFSQVCVNLLSQRCNLFNSKNTSSIQGKSSF